MKLIRTAMIAAASLCLAACNGAAAPSIPSSIAASTGAPAPAPATPAATATTAPSPSASALPRLPMGRVVFDRLADSPEGQFLGMYTVGADGVERQVKLPGNPGFAYGVWSTDGRKLLLDSFSDPGGPAVGVIDLATGDFAAINPNGISDGLDCSDWSPDDRTLVCGYGSSANVKDGIYLVDVATGTAKRLTKSPYHDTVGTAGECGGGEGRGVFSPDGRRIAYEQQQCGTGADPSSDETGAIVVMAVDGSARKTVVPFGGVRTHPGGEISWSPNGKLIAFGTQEGELSVVAPDGSGLRQIPTPATANGTRAIGPSWSPDGKWLLVGIGGNGLFDLFVVAADGSGATQLTSTALTEAYTDWGPAAP